MKVTVTSDDGKQVVDVDCTDIDFAGHTMNRVILDWRFRQAVNSVCKYEEQHAEPSKAT